MSIGKSGGESSQIGMDKKIAIVSSTQKGLDLFRFFSKLGYGISCYVTIDSETASRNKVSGYVNAGEELRGEVKVHYVKSYDLKEPIDVSYFKTTNYDLLVLGGWQRLIPKEILSTLSIGALGTHGSSEMLPKGRGRSPLNWSIIQRKTRFVISLFKVREGVDDGDIYGHKTFDINHWDDIKSLYYKNSIATEALLEEFIPGIISGTGKAIPQIGDPSYYEKRTEKSGLIDWENMDVFEIHNLIRATTRPYPGAFSRYNGAKLVLWKGVPFDTRLEWPRAQYGEIVRLFNDAFLVKCLSGSLLVTEFDLDSNMELYEGMVISSNELG